MVRILPAAVGVVVLGLMCWWFGIDQLTLAVHRLDVRSLLLYVVLLVAVLLGYCLRWKAVTRALGSRLPFGSLVTARLAGDAVGTLVPSAKLAGEPVRIALVQASGVRGAEAAAGVALDRVLELIGNILSALAYVGVFAFTRTLGAANGTPPLLVLAMLAGLAALTVPLLMLRRGKRPLAFLYGQRARRAVPRISRWLDGLQRSEDRLVELFRHHPRVVPVGIAASLAIEALIVVEYHFLLKAFGIDLDLPTLLLVLLGSGVARAAPSPAGIGALEAGQVTLLALANGTPETGFVVGMVLRLHETLLITAGFVALAFRGVTPSRLRSLNMESGAAA
jgi:uncharacterized protein (TIRG00374 family)